MEPVSLENLVTTLAETKTVLTNEAVKKLVALSKTDYELAFDDCHKIYVLRDESEYDTAAALHGYSFHDASDIFGLVANSCGLVFVNEWSLEPSEYTLDQFSIFEEESE